MSCGDPHETPCSEVLDAVYLYLDGEQDSKHHEMVRLHLDECSPCLRQYGLEEEVKRLVHRSCRHETVPAGLRDKIMIRLEQVTVEVRRDSGR